MDALIQEFATHDGPPWTLVLLRLVGATVLCGVLGFERETRDHPAGLRTNMLIGLAAAAFTIISIGLIERYEGDNIRIDPLRLIEAVTGGVAFLAAGLIVFAQGAVRNLTTGASIWLSAAIGLAAGLGNWMLAVVATLSGIFILNVVRRIQIGLEDGEVRRGDADRDSRDGR